MAYTPPAGDAVNFSFTGSYTPPSGSAVNFLFGAVATVTVTASKSNVYPNAGFNSFKLTWQSSISGPYRIKMGGTGASTGALLDSGEDCIANTPTDLEITASDITTASGYSGYGTYRFNVYVKSVDDIWNPYE